MSFLWYFRSFDECVHVLAYSFGLACAAIGLALWFEEMERQRGR